MGLVNKFRKHLILGVIRYHQFQELLFDEMAYHPETKKMLEELHFQVEHNLPVKKEVILDLLLSYFSKRCPSSTETKSIN